MATVTVVGLSSVVFSTPASANPMEELEKQQAEIEEEREELKANLSDAEAEIADLVIDLEELNAEIERADEALEENKATMKENEDAISETEKEVDKLEGEIEELEEAIEVRFEILKERAASYQKNGGNISFLEVLFGAQDFMDFISRVSAINKITESDATLMEKIEEDKEAVQEKQDEVVAHLNELKEKNVELVGMQELIEDQQERNKEQKAELKEREETLVAKVEELEIKDSELASIERDVRESITQERQPVANMQVASANTNSDNNSSDANLTTVSDTETRSAPSGGVQTAINAGFAHLGTPYVWAGKGPGGFDCSGFVSWAFAQGGISIPSNTGALAGTGTKVSTSNMQPGDLVFFDTYKTNGHVGIYLGGGQFIGAQNSTGLAVADMTSGYWADKFNGHVRSVR
jgi:cell wall-associated NlpC family hydrolase